jgi:hypothetical protein
MGFVGIFFYINDDMVYESTSLDEAEKYGDFKVHKKGHFEMWEERLERKLRKPYDYYPRGRVVYNQSNNTFRIFLDKCLKAPEIIEKIIQIFNLKTENIEIDDSDPHYVCSKCSRQFIQ